MYCRELFEQFTSSRIPQGVLREPPLRSPAPATDFSSHSAPHNFTPLHLYHSKYFINSFVSQTSARLRPQTLSFDRHPFFAGGWVGYQPCQQRIHTRASIVANTLSRPALNLSFSSAAGDSNRPTISSLNLQLLTFNFEPSHPELLNFPFRSASAVECPLSSFFPPVTSHSSQVTVPLSPLDKPLTDTPSRNPLYLPLLRKNGGEG
jgi:hypothetical protein